MIDESEKAMALIEKMEAQLPILVYATPQLLETMERQEEKYSKNQIFSIKSVHYAGDMGGITCTFSPDKETVYSVSITHLRIPENHILAEEIKAYQRQRVRQLAIKEGKLGRAKRLAKKSRTKKGFSI
jgi:hypothetical protein